MPKDAPRGRRHTVSGVKLVAYSSATGAPAVIFLPGAGLVGLDFLKLHEQIARSTTSVIYDRAGTGWSDTVALPRHAADVARELHALLALADIPGPYVLVGHSLGGAYARRYAQVFPDEVAALVLLDPFHEDLYARAPQAARDKLAAMNGEEMPEPTDEQLQAAVASVRALLAAWPDDVRDDVVDHHVTTSWRTGVQEGHNLYDDVGEELRGGGALPDVPLIVITALGTDATQDALWSAETPRVINEAKTGLHALLAASTPHGQQRIIREAGHGWLREECRVDVLEAIHDVLANVDGRVLRWSRLQVLASRA